MRPWPAFTFSLVAACGLHALILLVPRPAGLVDEGIPAIELALESARAADAGTNVGPAPVRRAAARAAVSVALPTQGPAPAPAPVAPNEKSEALLQPPTMEPAAGPSDANELPETAASGVRAGAVDQARVSGVSVGAAVTGGTGGRGDGAATIDVITPARARAEILPVYPRSARKAGLEGFVRIAAVIDESGIVVSAEVLASSGNSVLDQAALQEVRRAIFEPARLAGKPVPFRLIIPFRFRLN